MHEDCMVLMEKISEYLDGELDPDACREIEEHLRECQACRHCFESLKKTTELCKKFPREKVPDPVRRRLRESLRACLEGRTPGPL